MADSNVLGDLLRSIFTPWNNTQVESPSRRPSDAPGPKLRGDGTWPSGDQTELVRQ